MKIKFGCNKNDHFRKKIENIFINIFYSQRMSASERARLLHSLPLSENAARICLFGARRRQLESSSDGRDCLHFESFKVNLDLV